MAMTINTNVVSLNAQRNTSMSKSSLATSMECLSDYKDLRYDKDVRKAYLEGRFSGVPHLKPFRRRVVRPGLLEQSEFHLNEDATDYQTPPKSSE